MKYPFKEGDTYYTIENQSIIEPVWDDVSEEDFSQEKKYYQFAHARKCHSCGCGFNEGYNVNDEEYYCSDSCLYQKYSRDEWDEMYANDEGYYTEWECVEDFDYVSNDNKNLICKY